MRLDGIRILDLSRLLPGPYATQLLAYAGADVIKVEDTGVGDYARDIPPRTADGTGAVFDAVNRGKRSVTIDLKTDRGQAIFHRLVADADVVFETFRPGIMERLGASYDKLTDHNEELIYCSLSGFGQDGPYADKVGHDLNYVGVSGLLEMTRKDGTEIPRIPGFPIADMGGGLFAAFAIVGALLSRELGTESAQYVDLAMADVITSFSQLPAAYRQAGAEVGPGKNRTTGGFACYNVYETADGQYLTVGALEPHFWRKFCEVIGREDLIDRQFPDDDAARQAVIDAIAETLAEKPRGEWIDTFEGEDVAVAPVNDIGATFDDPQVCHRTPDDEGITRAGLPLAHAGSDLDGTTSVPGQGEDTETVLRKHGFTDEQIAEFQADNVV